MLIEFIVIFHFLLIGSPQRCALQEMEGPTNIVRLCAVPKFPELIVPGGDYVNKA